MSQHETFLWEAVRLAKNNRERGGRPFAAVLAIDGQVVSTAVNDVVQSNDPTMHAEMEAVRAASRNLGRADLRGSIVYASGHPCRSLDSISACLLQNCIVHSFAT